MALGDPHHFHLIEVVARRLPITGPSTSGLDAGSVTGG